MRGVATRISVMTLNLHRLPTFPTDFARLCAALQRVQGICGASHGDIPKARQINVDVR